MKKIFAILLALSVLSFTAAFNRTVSEKNQSSSKSVSKEGIITLKNGEWPDNQYTEGILEPNVGTVTRSWIDSKEKFLCIFLSNISKKEAENYTNSLKEDGFTPIDERVEKTGEKYTSYVGLLQKDNIYVSFSYTNKTLGLYIKKGNNPIPSAEIPQDAQVS
jgi:hypothetical protein